MKKKKIAALLLSVLLCISAFGCSEAVETDGELTLPESSNENSVLNSEEESEISSEESKEEVSKEESSMEESAKPEASAPQADFESGVSEEESSEEEKLEHLRPISHYQVMHDTQFAKYENVIYLTFDDGPSANTPKVLDILDLYHIKATFFVVPRDTDTCKARLKEIVNRGHSIAIHTYSHDYYDVYRSVDAYIADFEKALAIVEEATGESPKFYRFPGGSKNKYNRGTRDAIIEEMTNRGYTYYDWDISGQDAAKGLTPVMIRDSMLYTLSNRKGGVMLLHDSATSGVTVEALPYLIEILLDKGHCFDKLVEGSPTSQFPR